jgi:hypothetical protein
MCLIPLGVQAPNQREIHFFREYGDLCLLHTFPYY